MWRLSSTASIGWGWLLQLMFAVVAGLGTPWSHGRSSSCTARCFQALGSRGRWCNKKKSQISADVIRVKPTVCIQHLLCASHLQTFSDDMRRVLPHLPSDVGVYSLIAVRRQLRGATLHHLDALGRTVAKTGRWKINVKKKKIQALLAPD